MFKNGKKGLKPKMKTAVKIFSVLLALIMAFSAVACAGTQKNNEKTDEPVTTNAPDTEPDEVQFEKDNLPSDIKSLYDGKTVTGLVWEDVYFPEFYIEEPSGDIVSNSIYKRNLNVSERLGIKLNFVEQKGSYNYQGDFVNYAYKSISGSEQAFDYIGGYSSATAALILKNVLTDLANEEYAPYLDYDKPWWPKFLIEEASVRGQVRAISGDISTNLIYMMFGIYFNKELLDTFNVEDPYPIAEAGNWTIDQLIEMAKVCYTNEDDESRRYYGFYSTHNYPWYHTCGFKYVEHDSDGDIYASDDIEDERVHSLIVKLCDFLYTGEREEPTNTTFKDGKIAFTLCEMYYAASDLRSVEFSFGFLPPPKYDENQESYITCLSFPHTLYAIPKDVKDSVMSSAVLEALASESYRTVSPVLFEDALKVKYSDIGDAYSSRMYDYTRAGVTFDMGRMFGMCLFDDQTWAAFSSCISDNNPNWASKAKGIYTLVKNRLKKLTKAMTAD